MLIDEMTEPLDERQQINTEFDREYFCYTALNLINGKRQDNYGEAERNFSRIADIWSAILDEKLKCPITPGEVAACMVGVKLSRLSNDVSHRDSWVDIIGYAALGGEITSDK
jgi:hypothetical protein